MYRWDCKFCSYDQPDTSGRDYAKLHMLEHIFEALTQPEKKDVEFKGVTGFEIIPGGNDDHSCTSE